MDHDKARTGPTNRAQPLIAGGKDYFTMKPPTYQEFTVDDVVNIKSVQGVPVYGDGSTDDTDNINTILSMYAGCKIIYFPAGTYIVSDTVFIPVGSRIIGDAFASAISGVGKEFMDEHTPRPMVRMGYPGDTGIGQINDMILTVADVLPGCKMVRCPPLTKSFAVQISNETRPKSTWRAANPAMSGCGTPTFVSAVQ